MKLKQEARVLRRKALSSLMAATTAFNSPHDEGRTTQVLLSFQHAFEMLLKAALVQTGVSVFDKKLGRSLGFEECVKKALGNPTIRLSEADAGTLRAIDAMRDDEQHWFNHVSEQILYLHARAGITLFDELLHRTFEDRLANYLPVRVLPLSVDPPQDVGLLLDAEYSQIEQLLKPGRRARHEARARIRTLLAMEAHLTADARVSAKDVDRVEKGVRAGEDRLNVFPRLNELTTQVDGEGMTVKVHFTKKQGAPVRYITDSTTPAAAVREVDLQRKYYLSRAKLAERVGVNTNESMALRRHLGIDDDINCCHIFKFGSQEYPSFSDNAITKMTDALVAIDVAVVAHAHRKGGPGVCDQPGCQGALQQVG
jgi:hypothetical protein